MILNGVYYGRPTDNVITGGVVALSVGSANAAFPLANLYDKNPAKVFKATGTGCTITFTFGGAQTLQAFSLHTHNLPGATVALTNNAGMASQAITIPADDLLGLSVDPFKDLRAVANNSATVWTLTITGAAANVAIGEIGLWATLRELDVLIGAQRGNKIPSVESRTSYLVSLPYALGVKQHWLKGEVILESLRADLVNLFDSANGIARGFLVIPDLDTNECFWMKCIEDEFAWVHAYETVSEMTVGFEEVGRGPGV